MSDLLLVQDVFLLAHDDESGKAGMWVDLPGALAGALLLDLAEQELVTVEDDRLRATDRSAGDPLLARAQAAVRDDPKLRTPDHWLHALPKALKPFDRTVGESLVERGILDEERGKVLGLFPTTRWPERDPGPEQQLRAGLRDALLGSADPPPRAMLLATLLHQYGMVDGLVDKPDRKAARARAKDLAERTEAGDAVSRAVGDAVRAAQMAVLTATLAASAATTASTVATSGSS